MKRGFLFAFEGSDFVGKTTTIKGVYGALNAKYKDVVSLRAPGGTVVGEKLRSILLDSEKGQISSRTELFMLLAAWAQLHEEVILPALNRGKIVLLDRYVESAWAYQGAGRGLDRVFLKRALDFATMGVLASKTFLLYADEVVIKARAKKKEKESKNGKLDRIEREDDAFFDRVRDYYESIKEKSTVLPIDTGRNSVDQVVDNIVKQIELFYDSVV